MPDETSVHAAHASENPDPSAWPVWFYGCVGTLVVILSVLALQVLYGLSTKTEYEKKSNRRFTITSYEPTASLPKLGRWNGRRLDTVIVQFARDAGFFGALALDGADKAYVAYFQLTSGELRLAREGAGPAQFTV